jgi:hypothetical protein
LSTEKLAAAVSRINNYLPNFPEGTPASKYTEPEVVGLLVFAIPERWRKAMDLKGVVPSACTKQELVDHCDRIERNEVPSPKENKEEYNNNNSNKNKNKKVQFVAKPPNRNGDKYDNKKPSSLYCRECGTNPSHDTAACWVIKRKQKEAAAAGNGKGTDKPYSKRTFRKEINAMARRAGKHDGLDIMSSAVKREQGKHSKKSSKKPAAAAKKPSSDDSDTSSDESMHNMEAPIPRKNCLGLPKRFTKEDCEKRYAAKRAVFKTVEEAKAFIAKYGNAIHIDDSSDDDESTDGTKATDEETAFLKSIDKEEADQSNSD